MSDYLAVKDPNWGEINIWGKRPEIDNLPWYDKYTYLKDRFAPNGVLAVICRGHFLLGKDATAIYEALREYGVEESELIYQQSPMGMVLRFESDLYIMEIVKELGFTLFQYFAGIHDHSNEVEYLEVSEFLEGLDGRIRTWDFPAIPSDNEPLVQMRLFE